MYSLNDSKCSIYHTTGQVAKSLRVSVSTIKRWLDENPGLAGFRTNASGWRLFSSDEIENIREHQRKRKREGK
ncbi:MAG TPA: MerR family transcriptional regulator, partial [Fibrobacteria bacterium]|nr:MerR family transcriptional regulator [Fibrobacteria bacterium]